YEFGNAGSSTFSLPNSSSCSIVSVATAAGGGFWALTKCGAVLGAAGATSLGGKSSLGHTDFTELAATPDGLGYWVFEQPVGGSVTMYHFGDATEETDTGIGSGTLVATVGDPNM